MKASKAKFDRNAALQQFAGTGLGAILLAALARGTADAALPINMTATGNLGRPGLKIFGKTFLTYQVDIWTDGWDSNRAPAVTLNNAHALIPKTNITTLSGYWGDHQADKEPGSNRHSVCLRLLLGA